MSQRSAVENLSDEMTWEEVPGFFPAGDETLFGVLTQPAQGSVGTGVIFVPGGWFGTSIGINRLLVTYCRALAGEGYPSMRFDYHGVGESSGSVDTFALQRPFREDLEGAIRWLKGQGIGGFVLVGVCFGGRAILQCASDIPELQGVCLISVPVHDVGGGRGAKVARLAKSARSRDLLSRAANPWLLRNLFKANVRRMLWRFVKLRMRRLTDRFRPSRSDTEGGTQSVESPVFLNGLQSLSERQLPVLMIHGTGDGDYESLKQAMEGRVGQMVHSDDSNIEVVTVPGSIHGFTRVEAQTSILQIISRWVRDL